MSSTISIVRAAAEHATIVAPLMDAYRQFYRQQSDVKAAQEFVRERLQRRESVIYLAVAGTPVADEAHGLVLPPAVGFVQLYPMFTSVGLRRTWILNDLYVDTMHRRSGAATLLMQAAEDHAKSMGAASLALLTEHTNTPAQALYDQRGWKQDVEYRRYTLKFPTT